jgi:intracellular sulfur oxidation DsrE/DsrF family protein
MSSHCGIVAHVTSGDCADWRMALRNLSNLAGNDSVSTPPDLMKVVVNGDAVRFLLTSASEADRITAMADAGVQINACTQSLTRLGYAPENLADGVQTIRSGVAEVARIQQQGDTYLKLP